MIFPLEFTYYLPTKTINQAFKGLAEKLSMTQQVIGHSQLNQPLTTYSWGDGEVVIALWTQMHGNESTGTFSALDLLQYLVELPEPRRNEIKQKVSLHLLPNLNPDGSDRFTRPSHSGIDLNRDSVSLSTPEMKAFWTWIKDVNPSLALNMHDQRSRFKAGDKVATLSFLAPSPDENRSINSARRLSMSIIGNLYTEIVAKHNLGVGKYTDEFYPLATGDNLISRNIPTILFEAGTDALNESSREVARSVQTECLISILENVQLLLKEPLEENVERYNDIPVNEDCMCDYLLKNINIPNSNIFTDVAIDIHRFLDDQNHFKQCLIIREIGNLEKLTPVYDSRKELLENFTKVNVNEVAEM